MKEGININMKNHIYTFESDKWPKTREGAEKTATEKNYETLLCINNQGVFMGRSKSGVWCVGLPEDNQQIKIFIKYENNKNRKVIIWSDDIKKTLNICKSINNELETDKSLDDFYMCKSHFLCHSTCIESFSSILQDEALLSYNEQIRLNRKIKTVRHNLREPNDYFDYVDLCLDSSISSEIVVASRQYGKIDDYTDTKYKPGVRIYFSIDNLKGVNGVCCDGLHALKVYKSLPLDSASSFVFFSRKEYGKFILNCGLDVDNKFKSRCVFLEDMEYWTPNEYIKKANNMIYCNLL